MSCTTYLHSPDYRRAGLAKRLTGAVERNQMDRLKAIVTSALAFGTLAIPGFAGFVAAVGGDAEIMQAVVGAYAVYHILRVAVDVLHSAVAGPILLVLLVALPASAQQRASISLDSALAPDSVESWRHVHGAYSHGHCEPLRAHR